QPSGQLRVHSQVNTTLGSAQGPDQAERPPNTGKGAARMLGTPKYTVLVLAAPVDRGQKEGHFRGEWPSALLSSQGPRARRVERVQVLPCHRPRTCTRRLHPACPTPDVARASPRKWPCWSPLLTAAVVQHAVCAFPVGST